MKYAQTHDREGVGGRVVLQQHVHDLGVTLLGGLMERRVAQLVLDVDLDLTLQQEPDHPDGPEVAGHVQGRVSGLRLGIQICSVSR